MKGLAGGVSNKRNAEQNPDKMAPVMNVPLDHLIIGHFTGNETTHVRQVGIQVIRIGDRLKVARQQFPFVVADDLAERTVDLKPASVERHDGHPDGSVIEGAAEPLLAVSQGRQGICPLGKQRLLGLELRRMAEGGGDQSRH
jgi:hypothetical protein